MAMAGSYGTNSPASARRIGPAIVCSRLRGVPATAGATVSTGRSFLPHGVVARMEEPLLSGHVIRDQRFVLLQSRPGFRGVYHRAGPMAGSGRTRWLHPGYFATSRENGASGPASPRS